MLWNDVVVLSLCIACFSSGAMFTAIYYQLVKSYASEDVPEDEAGGDVGC